MIENMIDRAIDGQFILFLRDAYLTANVQCIGSTLKSDEVSSEVKFEGDIASQNTKASQSLSKDGDKKRGWWQQHWATVISRYTLQHLVFASEKYGELISYYTALVTKRTAFFGWRITANAVLSKSLTWHWKLDLITLLDLNLAYSYVKNASSSGKGGGGRDKGSLRRQVPNILRGRSESLLRRK